MSLPAGMKRRSALNLLYAMQRANGDWFAFADRGRLRVPVFRSSGAAMLARARNSGMLLFKPMALDERALNDLAPAGTTTPAGFWLVDDPSLKLSRGRSLEHAQLALLVDDATERPEG